MPRFTLVWRPTSYISHRDSSLISSELEPKQLQFTGLLFQIKNQRWTLIGMVTGPLNARWTLGSDFYHDASHSFRLFLLLSNIQVYIGDLGEDATRRELEEAFDKFGRVRNVWIAKRPPGQLSWPKQSSKSISRLCFCSYGRSKRRRGCDKGA